MKNKPTTCKRCGLSDEETQFYADQRVCALCMKIGQAERQVKERAWIANAPYKTKASHKTWNDSHDLDFGDATVKYRIGMGLETYTTLTNIKKDKVDIR